MPIIKVGYRRLYDSLGCSITDNRTVDIAFPLGEHYHGWVYMGPKPKFGINVVTGEEEYLIPGVPVQMHGEYQADATQSSYPRSFFTEVTCIREVDVSVDLAAAFQRNEQQASNELLQLVADNEKEFRTLVDFLSGIIGLRYHPQFIIELINENFVAFSEANRAVTSFSRPFRQLESIQITDVGIDQMSQFFPAISTVADKQAQSCGRILGWLMCAWFEKDIVAKFNAMFIPLEMILEGVRGELSQDRRQQVEKIHELINTFGGEHKEELQTFLNQLIGNQRPSLIDRFSLFAEQARMPGWEHDIQAFRHFNKIRNGLIHRGDPNVRIYVTIGANEVYALEDLTERYVNYALFRDTAVYQSRFQHRPTHSAS
jgi:hypothetical protein